MRFASKLLVFLVFSGLAHLDKSAAFAQGRPTENEPGDRGYYLGCIANKALGIEACCEFAWMNCGSARMPPGGGVIAPGGGGGGGGGGGIDRWLDEVCMIVPCQVLQLRYWQRGTE